jgi:hypothetical protein
MSETTNEGTRLEFIDSTCEVCGKECDVVMEGRTRAICSEHCEAQVQANWDFAKESSTALPTTLRQFQKAMEVLAKVADVDVVTEDDSTQQQYSFRSTSGRRENESNQTLCVRFHMRNWNRYWNRFLDLFI